MDKAVVLMSGGVNSLVAAAAVREQYEVCLLHVAWGHRSAERERMCFERIGPLLKIEHSKLADLSCMMTLGTGARVARRQSFEDASTIEADLDAPPASFTPGLLSNLLSLAATWAGQIEARRIVIGTSENHGTSRIPISHLYPDYRREFLQSFNLVLQYGRPRNRELAIEAPLLELSRSEVVKLGDAMEVPFEQTWSCLASSDNPCGRCLGCHNRTAGFLQAGVPDPLLLEPANR
jgi:7-cyano-7-deazaguanine synthase